MKSFSLQRFWVFSFNFISLGLSVNQGKQLSLTEHKDKVCSILNMDVHRECSVKNCGHNCQVWSVSPNAHNWLMDNSLPALELNPSDFTINEAQAYRYECVCFLDACQI